jgi:uncharacterized protein YfcZ (UPF0381/DUF406 family)
LKRILAAYGLSFVVVAGVLGGFAMSPPEQSSADLSASTTSTTLPPGVSGSRGARLDAADTDLDGLSDADDPCPGDTRNECFGPVAFDTASGSPLRLKAAPASSLPCATAQVDCNGDLWVEQFGTRVPTRGRRVGCPQKGKHSHACTFGKVDEILGCDDEATQRVFRCGQRPMSRRRPIVYEFEVSPGTYLVNLYFAAGAPRVPDRLRSNGATILVNDTEVYTRFDPADVAAVGTLVVRAAVAEVTDGTLRIELRGVRRRTALRAIEVLAPATSTTSGQPAVIADGRPLSGAGTPASLVPGDDDNDGITNASDPCPTDARNHCVGPVATDTVTGKKLRVNANISSAECSGPKTDCNGDAWVGDFGYNQSAKANTCNLNGGGEACVVSGISAIFGCDSESTGDLFQCDHSDQPAPPELAYSFAVPNGSYVVNLFFANTYTGTTAVGSRVFDIRVEGATAYPNFDQVAAAGGSAIAVVRSVVVNVTDGNGLQIDFVHRVENPAVKAIEVLVYSTAPCTGDAQCNDQNACTTDTCVTGTCTHTNNTAPCADDGNPCTSDVCSAGACTHPATTGPCTDDGNPCTDDVCSSAVCTHPANAATCEDGLTCTINDACTGGACTGTSLCSAGEVCSPSTSQCVPSAADNDNDGLGGSNDPCPTDPRNRCAGPVAIDSANGKQIRLNANVSTTECSGTKTDCNGEIWLGDFGYNQSQKAGACNLNGGGENCVISGITEIFGCDSESTGDLFQCEHSDAPAAPELAYSFTLPNGRYVVNLFFANTFTGTTGVGSRVFDIRIEGTALYSNFDQVAAAGASAKAVVRSAIVNVVDGNGLQIDFVHHVENPALKAIEVLVYGATSCTTPSECNDNNPCTDDTCSSGVCINAPNTLTCNDGVACTANDVCSNGFCRGTSTCPAGQSCNTNTGTCGAASISFGKSTLAGAAFVHPTSLQFGPDGKLYVAQQDGLIKVHTVVRNAANNYAVTSTQTITSVQTITNHNDDGTANAAVQGRLVTGILVKGTAANPVIYVMSSDPRIGGGAQSTNTNLDTNSGILSRLTWNGSAWVKLDLVRGLPRSEENHTGNGLALNAATNTLYIAYGGNTNEGAPANNFVYLPEYALSAAILSVNLTAIGNTTYDLPTLDDETRAGNPDANDPFGGNDGKNQARIVAGGPVQVYSSGWRNPYDICITQLGKMFSIDNGANAGWGDVPIGNGTASCTNGVSEPGQSFPDQLHIIPAAGFYAGHPNPTRGNVANTFNASNPQSPVLAANSVECTFKTPGVTDGALTTFPTSTNGLSEYPASNFGGQLRGDLLAAGWDNKIYRLDLNAAGTGLSSNTVLFTSVIANSKPLDVTAQGDSGPFPGSIWATDYNGGAIVVFEAADAVACGGQYTSALDDDGDGFDNADEIDNGTNPCSAADTPPDADGDHDSNLNDPDDDNDTVADNTDPFARDAQNGKNTNLPILYSWENGDPSPGGILGLGFTGLMTNGVDDYESLFNLADVTSGGAAGVFTVDNAAEGDAFTTLNTQRNGFQLGVNVTGATGLFTAHTRIVGPFLGLVPRDYQSMGLFIGTGRQSDYVKLTTSANGGLGGIEVMEEVNNNATANAVADVTMPGPDAVDLYLTVDPALGTVQEYYKVTTGGVAGPLTALNVPIVVPLSWFSDPAAGLAVGILSTSRGAAPPFAATYDFIAVTPGPAS